MRYKILVLLTFVLLGCSSEKENSQNFLSKEQMVSLLIDIHVLEGKVDRLNIKRDSTTLIFNTLEREIFNTHQIDYELYERSYKYYLEDVKSMDEIYMAVVDSLSLMQTAYKAKHEIQKEQDLVKAKEARQKRREENKELREQTGIKLQVKDTLPITKE